MSRSNMDLPARKPLLIGIGVTVVFGLLLLAVVLLTPSPAPAIPTISWTPSSITEMLVGGESKTLSIFFKSSEGTPGVIVRVVPELQPFIRVNPAMFPAVIKGETVRVDLTLSAPLAVAAGTFEGTIELNSRDGKERAFANPLPVVLSIRARRSTQIVSNGVAVTFSYHPDWTLIGTGVKRLLYSPGSSATIAGGDLVTPPDITIMLLPNTSGLQLQDFVRGYRNGWFADYKERFVTTIGSHDAVLVNDLTSEIPRVPELAAFIVVDPFVLLITGHQDSEVEFNNVLGSLQLP